VQKTTDLLADPKENISGDMDATDLADKLEILSDILPEEMNEYMYALRKKLPDTFPNVTVALRIFLSMPVSVA
jgi:hypothetical protein